MNAQPMDFSDDQSIPKAIVEVVETSANDLGISRKSKDILLYGLSRDLFATIRSERSKSQIVDRIETMAAAVERSIAIEIRCHTNFSV